MAALPYSATARSLAGRIPTKFYSVPPSIGVDNNGFFVGNTSELGVGSVAGVIVRLYYRPTGGMIRETRSDPSGNFAFTGLDSADTKNYYMLVLDPDGGALYNALIFDRITPAVTPTNRALQQQLNSTIPGFGVPRTEHYLYEQLQSLLLHFDGTNGSTTFTDSSLRTKTVTRNSGDGALSTVRSAVSSSSSLLMTNGYLSAPDHADFQFGANDFTIEAWVYQTSTPGSGTYRGICGRRNGSSDQSYTLYLSGDASGAVTFELNSAVNTRLALVTAGVPTLNAWNHVAAVRSGSTLTAYLNGVAGTPATIGATAAYTGSYVFQIGSLSLGGSPFVGNIDELRVINGSAVYTSNFTPPTAPFSP